MKRLVVLSGAGISAESGIQTFRDADGLWEGHDVKAVATPEGFMNNPALVLEFYNQRRRQLDEVLPNKAHLAIAELQAVFDVAVVTQNVDDLHERAGSENVIHLHGELKKMRSSKDETLVYPCQSDIKIGDQCEKGSQLRPHIVWFGEEVPLLVEGIKLVSVADIVLVIGSSMQVYPAASLVAYAPAHAQVVYIDPRPSISYELSQRKNLEIIAEKATIGIDFFISKYVQNA